MAGLPNLNPFNKLSLKCDDGTSFKAIVFEVDNNESNLAVVQGSKTLAAFPLGDFFIPVTKYQTQDLVLLAGESLTVSGCNMESAAGEVEFIGILITYPEFDNDQNAVETEDKFIKYEYPVEYKLNRINQIQIKPKINLTFANIHVDQSGYSTGGIIRMKST